MFNGIIRNTGVIKNIERYSNSMIISVKTNLKVNKNKILFIERNNKKI